MDAAQAALAALPHLKPELCLGAGVMAVLGGELFLSPKEKPALGWMAAAFALLSAFLAVRAPVSGPGGSPLLFADGVGPWLKTLFCLATLGVILLTLRSREAARMPAGETYAFLLAATLGCCLLGAARNLLMLYLAMEIVSYSSYLLAGFLRQDLRSNEAALKYVLYGAVASGTMLFGISLLYGMGRSLDLVQLSAALTDGRMAFGLMVPFALILVGLGFKVSAAPFHQWAPDVYEGAPTPVTAFLSVAPKAAGLAALAHLAYLGFSTPPAAGYALDAPGPLAVALNWPAVLGVLSAITMTTGNLCALFQTNVKRMLAYSSVAHAGYMLMGLAAASATGEGLRAVLFYAAIYAVMNLGAFGAVMAFAQVTGSESLPAWRGMGWKNPVLGASMVVFLMSLTGVPPFAGFAGKLFLFKAAWAAAAGAVTVAGAGESSGRWLYALILAGLLNSVVSLAYYVSVARTLFLDRPEEGEPAGSAGWLQPLVVALLAAATLALGVFWGPLEHSVGAALQGFGTVLAR